MIAPEEISSNEGPKKDVVDKFEVLSSILCTPVTVVLTRLTTKEINECCTTMKQKRLRNVPQHAGYPKRTIKKVKKKLASRKVSKARRRKKDSMLDVAEQEKLYNKTVINKEKSSFEEIKTDAMRDGEDGRRLQKKRKNIDAFDKKGNVLPRKRQKRLSVTTRRRNDTANNAKPSTEYTKEDCINHILSNFNQLQVSLEKLENIKDNEYVNIWRSKLLGTKSTASSCMIQIEKDRQLSEALSCVALHLNHIYPNKERHQTDAFEPLPEEYKTNFNELSSFRKAHKKSLKPQSATRISPRWSHKVLKDPQIVLTKFDTGEELSTRLPSVSNTECAGTKDMRNLQLGETEPASGNEDDDQDLIDEITLITNGPQQSKEFTTELDKTRNTYSPDTSPKSSPILGKSSARRSTKSKSNLQNIQTTVDETSSKKSTSGLKRGSTRRQTRAKPTQKDSKTTSVCAKGDNAESEDAEDVATESRLHAKSSRTRSTIPARSKSRAAGRVSKKIWPVREYVTRSLSRMEFYSPDTNLSRSPNPDVWNVSSKTARVRSPPKRISSSVVTDTSIIAETRSSDNEPSPSSSRVTSVDEDDTAVNRGEERSTSVEETRVSPRKSATRSPIRPSIHSPCRPPKTPPFVPPKSPTKSSATETRESNSGNQQEREKATPDPQIITNTATSKVEDTLAAVGQEKEFDVVLSEDEVSIQLIIDDDSTKETCNSTLSTLVLPSNNSELFIDQDQVVPMQESTVEFSGANADSSNYKIDEHQAGRNVANTKRATSVILTPQNLISDILDKKQKSAKPKPLATKRKKTLGRLSMGRTKPEKVKSRSKSRNPSTSKCIICDSEYNTYEQLQEHLRTHSRKQCPSTSGISPTDPCSDSMLDANKREQTFQDIGAAPSTCSKTAYSVASSSKSNQERWSLSTEVIDCPNEPSDVASTTSTELHPGQKKLENTPSSKAVKSKEKRIKCCNSSNACSVCGQKFESKDKLAAHIFVHTEEELQKAYEFARTAKRSNKQIESVRITLEESNLHDNVESNTSPVTLETSSIEVQDLDTGNATSTAVLESRECQLETAPVTQSRSGEAENQVANCNSEKQKQSQQEKVVLIPPGKQATVLKTTNPSKEKKSESAVAGIEVITLEDSESQNVTTDNNPSMRSVANENTERDAIVGITKPITVCECHRNDVTYGNYLRIEVALLCHSCRTVYRSMECFEMHYRSPQNAECNKNRLHGRSPKLFCTNCGMIFSSIQDVRQHLEVHARYNANVSTDFRCNLCKVIFVGIGSLFYIHWSNHLKNPLYIASKLSFPKNSVLAPKSKHAKVTEGSSPDEYLYVAEHICDSCKDPFSTAADLERHQPNCKNNQKTNKASPNKTGNLNDTIKVQPKIRLVCGICDQIFLDKVLFEKHAELKHKQHTEPQYICVALTTMSTVFSCSACTKMYSKLEDLATHWKTHDTKRERYMCKNCDKLHDSLESFAEHAKQYISDLNNSEVMCKVIYQESEFICKSCKFGFDSKVTMNKHLEMHGVSLAWRSAEIRTQQQPVTDLCLSESHGVDLLQIPETQNEKTKENNCTRNVVIGQQLREEQERASSVNSDKHVSDKSEVPFSCGQEEAEASEGELVIDYREMSENDRLQKTREKSTPSSTPDCLNAPITNKGATEDLDKGCASIALTEEASKPTNFTEKLPSHNSEPPRKGFLRVKTLAELTEDNIKRADQCFICKSVVSSTDELASHILTAHSNISGGQIAMDQTIGQCSVPNISQPPESGQNIASNTRTRPIHSELPNTNEPQQVFLVNGRLILNVQPQPNAIPQQQKPTWHTSEDRPVVTNHTPKPVSGYHKNLPACPSTRPLSTAPLRAPPRNPRLLAFRPKDNTSNSPILRIPQPTTTGQPQQAYRKTIYPQSQQRIAPKPSIPSTAIQHADGYSCKICPEFKGASVADYLLHELSAEHENRKKPPASQTATVQNQSYTENYEQLVAVATSEIASTSLNSGGVVQNQQQQPERLQLYATGVYSEPITYSPVPTNRIINYTVPTNAFVNTTSVSQTAPLNTQILIATPSARAVYQPLVFNNSTGIAVMNNGTCCFCSASFASDNILRLHINVKHPYACILCRKDFASPHELQAHKISHNLAWD